MVIKKKGRSRGSIKDVYFFTLTEKGEMEYKRIWDDSRKKIIQFEINGFTESTYFEGLIESLTEYGVEEISSLSRLTPFISSAGWLSVTNLIQSMNGKGDCSR
jgi:hypothetical protein